MLLSLHVKNLALIEEEEIEFADGLNILTGETGAGKSILIGSINLALGAKADKGVIRTGADYALVEAVFRLDTKRQREKLSSMGIEPDEEEAAGYGTILIKRKIYPGRSQSSVQGESVTTKELRELGETLLDIYGQRENGRLLRRQAQLGVIDEFAGEEDAELLSRVGELYRNWNAKKKAFESDDLDETARKREADLLAYEVGEIEAADLKEGEDEELETQYKKLSSFRKIDEALQAADQMIEGSGGGGYSGGSSDFGSGEGYGGGGESAADLTGRAARAVMPLRGIDPELDAVIDQIADLDAMMSDTSRAISDYIDGMTFDPQEFQEIETRLDLVNHLKDKYGGPSGSLKKVAEALASRKERLENLSDYDASRARLQKEIQEDYTALMRACGKLSDLRHKAAEEFRAKMTEQLLDLNFNQVDFRVVITSGEEALSAKGIDDVRFFISMNPGEPARPLEDVASGGELSRIMLALKTVFAGKDDIHTFIFDEIDTGISGQTAWKVATKLGKLADDHQILCITHLPQIAAMEEKHFLIEKSTDGTRTTTHIRALDEEESTEELGRMMGGAAVTETTLDGARELKIAARKTRGEHIQ